MTRLTSRTRKALALVVVVAFFAHSSTSVLAKAPIKLANWSGTIDFSPNGPSEFTLEGNSTHLGKFQAYGEIDLAIGDTVADGVVVFRAANGDLLVGVTTWNVADVNASGLAFHWKDFVTFSDGTV